MNARHLPLLTPTADDSAIAPRELTQLREDIDRTRQRLDRTVSHLARRTRAVRKAIRLVPRGTTLLLATAALGAGVALGWVWRGR